MITKMNSPVFRGSGTALITPFKNGKIDFDSFEKLIEYQIQGGTDALIICGTTGEAATLSEKERSECIEFAVSKVSGRLPVIAGTGCNETSRAVIRSKEAYKAGADAILVVTPYYNKASAKGLVRHYTEVAKSADLPVIIYNVPSRTGVNIPVSVYNALDGIDNITGIKEASGNIVYSLEIIDRCGDRFDLYSGSDDQILPMLSIGAMGVISVISNIMPMETHRLCSSFFEGDAKTALEIQTHMLRIIKAMFSEVNPIPVKTALSMMGMCSEEFRMPLCTMEEENRVSLEKVMEKYNLIKPSR